MAETTITKESSTSVQKPFFLLFTLWLGHFAVDSFTGIWPIYKTLAGLDIVKAGLIASVAGFMGNGLQLVFGFIGDRGLGRQLLALGVLMAGAVSLLPYLGPENYLGMGVLMLITFIGSSAYHPVGTGTASTLKKSGAGKVTALFLSGGFIGFAVSQLIFTEIYHVTGGQTGIMMILSVAVAALLFFTAPVESKPKESLAAIWQSTEPIRRPLGKLYVVMICASAIHMGFIFILPDLLLYKSAPNWLTYGSGHMIYVMGACLGLLPSGHLADRYGPRQVMLIGIMLAAVGCFAVAAYSGENIIILAVLLALLGISNSTCNTVGVTYGSRLLPGQARTISGLLMGSAWCVAGGSMWIMGWLASPANNGNPEIAVSWLPVFSLVSLVLCYRLPRTKVM